MNSLKYAPLLCALYASCSLGSVDLATLEVASDLLAKGNTQDAWALLDVDHDADSREPSFWFLRGMAAKADNRLAEASGAFQKVIDLDPSADRARLEMAEVSYRTGDLETARSLLLAVKAKNPPARVGENIDRFLETIASAEPKSFRVYGSVGYMHDTNANAGTATDSVLMFGLPFTLSNSAMKTADDALMLRAGMDHAVRLSSSAAWQSGLSVNSTDYSSLHTLDALSVSLSSGPSWQLGEGTAVSLPGVGDWLRIGHDQVYYSYSLGVGPQVRHALGGGKSLSLASTLSRKWYKNQANRNLNAWSLAPALEWQTGEKSAASAGVQFAGEHSGLANYSNRLWGVNAGYNLVLADALRLSLGLQYSDTRYQGLEAAFSEIRHDQTTRLSAGLNYHIQPLGADASLSVSYTDNRSNLPLYTYDRAQISASIGKSF